MSAALLAGKTKSSVCDQVTTAKLSFISLIVEHNIPLSTADHFSKLCKCRFLDSKIAQEYSGGHTKTTTMVKLALAPAADKSMTDACRSSPLSLLCNSKND